MTFQVKNTKEDVLKIYKNCLNFLKKNFPNYYNVVSEYKFGFGRKRLHMVLVTTVRKK